VTPRIALTWSFIKSSTLLKIWGKNWQEVDDKSLSHIHNYELKFPVSTVIAHSPLTGIIAGLYARHWGDMGAKYCMRAANGIANRRDNGIVEK